MPMSAYEARTAKFTDSRVGYEKAEVDAFREAVADGLLNWEEEVGEVRKQLDAAGERLKGMAEAEEAVRQTFLAATTTKREMLAEAEEETSRRRAETAAAADSMREDAERDATEIRRVAEEDVREMLASARTAAAEADEQTSQQVESMERRLAQMRTAVRDIDDRIRRFASTASEDLGVTENMIDLETTTLGEIEAFRLPALEGMPAEPEAAAEPPVADVVDLRIEEAAPVADAVPGVVAAAEEVPAAEAPAEPVSPVEPEPATEQPAEDVAAPADEPVAAAEADDDEPADDVVDGPEPVGAVASPEPPPVVLRSADDDGFYQRRLAGLRRRIEESDDG